MRDASSAEKYYIVVVCMYHGNPRKPHGNNRDFLKVMAKSDSTQFHFITSPAGVFWELNTIMY